MNETRKRIREKVRGVAHYLTAFIVLVHGYEKMEKSESSYPLFYVAGTLIILAAIFHHRMEKWGPGYRIFHGIEALVLFIIAYDYFHHGKTALPFCYLLAGLGHLVAIWVKNRKASKSPAVATH